MGHSSTIRPVPVPEWTLHRPECACGWVGDIVRTHPLAVDQVTEHLGEEITEPDEDTDTTAQPALFDL